MLKSTRERLTPGDAHRYLKPIWQHHSVLTTFWKDVPGPARSRCMALRTAQRLVNDGHLSRYEALTTLDFFREHVYKCWDNGADRLLEPDVILFWKTDRDPAGVVLALPNGSGAYFAGTGDFHEMYTPPPVTSLLAIPRQYPEEGEVWFFW